MLRQNPADKAHTDEGGTDQALGDHAPGDRARDGQAPHPRSGGGARRDGADGPAPRRVRTAEVALSEFIEANLPWYGLDAGWQGKRGLGTVSRGPDGLVEFGTLRHGDPGPVRPDANAPRRAVTVLTMAKLERRQLYKPDGSPAGSVEPMTVSAAAALAGVGLVEDNFPWRLEPSMRQQWLDQQRELAYLLAETVAADPWQPLTLTVGERQQVFHYRESPYGWVMAAALPECFLAAHGRGVSAYSLAFVRVDPSLYV